MSKLSKEQQELLDKNPDLKAIFEDREKEFGKTVEELEGLKKAAAKADVALPVEGSFKQGSKTYKFKDGLKRTRLQNGELIDSAVLLKLANGKSLTKAEIDENTSIQSFGNDEKTQQAAAKQYVLLLIERKYAYLVEA